jgi:hypothetical protein
MAKERISSQKASSIAASMKNVVSHLGSGGGCFGVPVVSYAPRPMFDDLHSWIIIVSECCGNDEFQTYTGASPLDMSMPIFSLGAGGTGASPSWLSS